MDFLLFTNAVPLACRRTLLQHLGTSVTSCELHWTIFHMHDQYVCVIRNVHVEYTDQLSLLSTTSHTTSWSCSVFSRAEIPRWNSDYNLDALHHFHQWLNTKNDQEYFHTKWKHSVKLTIWNRINRCHRCIAIHESWKWGSWDNNVQK